MSFIPAASAQVMNGGDKPDEKGLFTKKNVKEFDYNSLSGTLELECFVTGETTAQMAPVDVVLVLDKSGSMNEAKMNGLKNGCYALLDQLMQIIDMGGNARIGIVTFNDKSTIEQEMTVLNLETIDGMKTIISKISADGDTAPGTGLDNAYKLLNTEDSANRQKMVILFTDGKPTVGDKYFSPAQNAIASAYNLKKISSEIFSVGLFDEDPSTLIISGALTILDFLEHVSSIYPRVSTLDGTSSSPLWLDENGKTNSFRDYSGTEYYAWAQTPDDLEGIFTNIGSIIVSKADIPLESKAVVKDVMSSSCAIPEGSDVSDIKVFSAPCIDGDPDDGYYFGDREDETGVTISILSNAVNVSGFDYGENWVGWNASTGMYQGKKLIIQIPFVLDPSSLVDKDVNMIETNDKDSGIYIDNTQVKPFGQFTIPIVTFVHIEISETGLLDEESSIFVLERKASGDADFTRVATVALTADKDNPGATVSKKIMYQDNKAEYRVSRLGAWSWTYSNPNNPEITPGEKLISFSFTNGKKEGSKTKYKERIKDNDFKGDNTLTPDVKVNPWQNSNNKRIIF